jgi:prepilin-type N-terminal cleavage/methylation domain-containing protein/prepilin-type processing-associated H-X9-DG protein
MNTKADKLTKSFSLIELLVVVAIIGILASLLMPSLSKAREKARISVCTSNQKQISTATALYMDDSEGYFPTAAGASGLSWDDLLGFYDGRDFTIEMAQRGLAWDATGIWGAEPDDLAGGVDHAPMYRCPLDERVLEGHILKTYNHSSLFFWGVPDVGINADHRGISGQYGTDLLGFSRKVSDLNSASQVSAYTENFAPLEDTTLMATNSIRLRIGTSWSWNGINATLFQFNEAGHSDYKFNFAMADGHVEKMNYFQSMVRSDGSMGSNADTEGTTWDSLR